MAAGEEHLIGMIPSRDGSDYSVDLRVPAWSELLDLIEEADLTRNELLVLGKGIYDASASVSGIGGVRGIFETEELYTVMAGEDATDPANTAIAVAELFGIPIPEH